MNKMTLCMIVKNEEKYIDNCLKSIHDIVDEIIIVDTGSTDNTKSICKKYTDKIYDYEWDNDFSNARNFSFSKSTNEYIMWLDADDILMEQDRIKLKKLKLELNNIPQNSISMIYNYAFNKDNKPTLTFKRNRIVRKSSNIKWIGFVHEVLDLNIEESYNSDIVITHTRNHSNTNRNLIIFEDKINNNVKFNQRDTLYYAKELFYNDRYSDAIIQFKKYLNGNGWIEDKIDSLIKISECYKRLNYNNDKIREPLFETFKLTHPRAEALYRIANSYITEKRYYEAIFYLESILINKPPKNCFGFLNLDMWEFLPNLQLCSLYYKIGNLQKSMYHHSICIKLRPTHDSVKYNDIFFKNIISSTNS